MPSFPGGLDTFTSKTDGIDKYLAADINAVQTAAANLQQGGVSQQTVTETVLVSGVDPTLGLTVFCTLTANRVVGAPLNPAAGRRLHFVFTQDGTGGRTLTFNAVFSITNWALNTAANARTEMTVEYDATAAKWVIASNPPPRNIALDQHLRDVQQSWANAYKVQGNPQPERAILTPTFSPALVAANTTAEQSLAMSSLQTGDIIDTVSKPTAQAGLGIVGWRLISATNIGITFSNNTGAGITPTAAEVYTVSVVRQPYAMPVITQGVANAATVIAGSVLIPPTSNKFRYSGAKTIGFGPTYPDDSLFYSVWAPDSITSNGTTGVGVWFVDFEFDGQQFEIYTNGHGASSAYRVRVDGNWVTPTTITGAPADGIGYLNLVNFGSRALRRISIQLAGGGRFGGIRCLPTDTVWAPTARRAWRTVFMGDSLTENASGDNPMRSWIFTCAEMMRWEDPWYSAVGATGYLADGGGGGKVTFRSRVVNDCINLTPDIVVLNGGVNDVNVFSASAIQTEVTLLIQQIQVALPSCKIIVVGPFMKVGACPATGDQAINNAAIACGVPFIDATGQALGNPPFLTGTGKVGATDGTGNCDFYMSNDGTHPSQAGSDYLGRRTAAAMLSTLVIP